MNFSFFMWQTGLFLFCLAWKWSLNFCDSVLKQNCFSTFNPPGPGHIEGHYFRAWCPSVSPSVAKKQKYAATLIVVKTKTLRHYMGLGGSPHSPDLFCFLSYQIISGNIWQLSLHLSIKPISITSHQTEPPSQDSRWKWSSNFYYLNLKQVCKTKQLMYKRKQFKTIITIVFPIYRYKYEVIKW